ncbi:GDSL-type esterase/lipase family protein [Allohahella marinimesophila]|uniref:GDSL-type esterase/lipase family protein n=1 Tax=Allohahella marinimesophila TaxID=1054972 RepID=UPI0031D5D65C
MNSKKGRIATGVLSIATMSIVIFFWLETRSSTQRQILQYRFMDSVLLTSKPEKIALGSSTIKYWPSQHVPCGPWLNRGIGGATINDVLNYVQDAPGRKVESVLLYVGDNDIAFGASPLYALKSAARLIQTIEHRMKPQTLYLLPVKWSPARAEFTENFKIFNRRLEQYASTQASVVYLPHRMQTAAYPPTAGLYLPDGLHLSTAGYEYMFSSLRKTCVGFKPSR